MKAIYFNKFLNQDSRNSCLTLSSDFCKDKSQSPSLVLAHGDNSANLDLHDLPQQIVLNNQLGFYLNRMGLQKCQIKKRCIEVFIDQY